MSLRDEVERNTKKTYSGVVKSSGNTQKEGAEVAKRGVMSKGGTRSSLGIRSRVETT